MASAVFCLFLLSAHRWWLLPVVGRVVLFFNIFLLVPLVIGTMFSGNVHQPSDVATVLSAFLLYWLIGYLIARRIARRRLVRTQQPPVAEAE